ncbi:MAG: hypothetical protein HYY23_16200 [Verrucomicrobia bacterium]|nr:hypothetical protein [Verrucomicrobiota bacterium]
MSADEIIELIKSLPLEERKTVLKFLSEELNEATDEKRAEDRKSLKRLGAVFGRKSLTGNT